MMDRKSIGRFQIRARLGSGGMATVYLAYDPVMCRDVAIKILKSEVSGKDDSFRTRFERETQIIARLGHRAVVPVYETGEEHGQPYIVMCYMPGGTLAELIDKDGPLSLDEAVRLLDHLADALDTAHSLGIVHRDLKPGNILLDRDHTPYLSDFGIAKILEDTNPSLTASGALGTPAYMSPEQAYGERNIDGRSDIYSLGVIVFEMLTGRALFEADTPMGVAMKHIMEQVPDITTIQPTLPADVKIVLGRALAKNPEDRYATVRAMVNDLAAVARGERLRSGQARPVTSSVYQPAGSVEAQRVRAYEEATRSSSGPVPARPKRKRIPSWFSWLIAVGVVALLTPIAVSLLNGTASLPAIFAAGDDVGGGLLAAPSATPGTPEPAGQSAPLDDAPVLDVMLDLSRSAAIHASAGQGLAVEVASGSSGASIAYERRRDIGYLYVGLPQPGMDALSEAADIRLTDAVPLDLTIVAHTGSIVLDLTGLTVESLVVEVEAADLEIVLPAAGDHTLSLKVEGGKVVVRVPESLEMRVDLDGLTERLDLAIAGLARLEESRWITPGFDSAADRVQIDVLAFSGTVSIASLR